MRLLLFFALIAGIAAGFEFNMSDSVCESLPVEIRFTQVNSTICEYYLKGPSGSSYSLGHDYSCNNLTVPWENITSMEHAWNGTWNATVRYSGNTSSKIFSIIRAVGVGNLSAFNRSDNLPAVLPGAEFEVVSNWTENCNDNISHRFSISAWDTDNEVYYGKIGVKNVSYRKNLTAPMAGGTYKMQLMDAHGGDIEVMDSLDVLVSSSRIDFSGVSLSGMDTVKISFSNAAGQGIVRDINIRLKGGFKEVSKSIVTPYEIPNEGGSITTTIPGGFQVIGLMPGTAYVAVLHAVVDEPEKDYVIERNFSGTFGGFCGDEICINECTTCPLDCSLAECKGDGACSKALGENCENSPSDCRCDGKEECFAGACITPRDTILSVSVTSDGAPVMNALVESQSGSCITDASGSCGLYAKKMDVIKVTKSGYLEQTGLAAEGVTISIAKEASKITAPAQVQDSGRDFAGIAKKAAPVALALMLVAGLINLLLKKKRSAAQGPVNAVPG